mgnify:CR=1 FL=1
MSDYVDKKQICFDGNAKTHADLKIRLHNDDINKSAKERKNRKDIISQFGLNKNEIEDIFDIIEKEHPNL